MHPLLNTAVKAARRAGSIMNRASLDIERIQVARKDQNDFVTEVDKACERAIIEVLSQAYPDHGFLGEESGLTKGDKPLSRMPDNVWIIDPIDGTTNFIHGMPVYCTSIGLMQKGVITQAVIYDPSRDELFMASKGKGAFLNDRRLRVTKQDRLDEALIGTGFPFKYMDLLDTYVSMFKQLSGRVAGLRRPGAAALDLAYVAAGRYDGFFEMGLMPWDAAAGSLLVTEAGGFVGDFQGGPDFLFSENIIAATPKVFAQMVAMLSPYKLPEPKAAGAFRPEGI
ncbi:MAG: inositol monophosphatase [Betaproteobacteria bacterium]|nr:inositol monophosphatase [Betaproteobacteria bacterium]NCA16830.1 inositol monophosphatase [Betaproteobacteria bacterium]